MKNAKLLIITSLFSFLLCACGMKGPLYHAPVTEAERAEQAAKDEQAKNLKANSETDFDSYSEESK